MANAPLCSEPDCTRPHYARGMCSPCYARHAYHARKGQPVPSRRQASDEGPDAPLTQRDTAGERRRLVEALRDGVPLTLLSERFRVSTATLREVAAEAGVVLPGGGRGWGP